MTGPISTKSSRDKSAEQAEGRSQERVRRPAPSGPCADILALQRTAGNQAVQRLLRSGTIQAKLTVNPPDDAYEREADHVAEEVMRMRELAVQRLFAQHGSDDSVEIDGDTAERINGAHGGGQALDLGVRAQMEPAFGADFSGVRVHTGAQADTLSRALHARAFTTGQDIFFRQGAYNPGISSGRELLAHELTHVVQQNSTRIQHKALVGQVGDRYEQESGQIAQGVIRRQQQPTTPQGQQAASPLVTFTGTNFSGQVRCDVQFVASLQSIDNYAGNRNVQVVVTSSFRLTGQAVTGQVVPAVNLGNHHAGHAIDMNVRYGGQLYNSVALAPGNLSNLPQAVQDFITDVRNDNALRWGGDFTTPDPVHIDDGLNLSNPTLFQQRVQAVQAAAQQPQQPAVQPAQ